MTASPAARVRRPLAVVVVALGHDRLDDTLRAFAPGLHALDEVVVVDVHGALSGARLARVMPRARLATPPAALSAISATVDTLVVLHDDVELTRRCLDDLVAPLDEPTVVAVGPRSNQAIGTQFVADTPGGRDRRATRSFIETWRREHRGAIHESSDLDGACFAVRRPTVESIVAVSGSDVLAEPWRLAESLRSSRLVVADAAYVHHDMRCTHPSPAHRRLPFVSACLIVKDEAELLAACIESVQGIADEVIVYDTGSTDATVAVARSSGATVLEGFWDDDFARARNVALAACRGEWILHIDADERLHVTEPDRLRAELTAGATDAYNVAIENLEDDGRVGTVHRACRLFRRARGEWVGRLHEQVVARSGQVPLSRAITAVAVIRHLGYTSELVTARDKAARNVRLAEADLDERPYDDQPLLLLNLARSLFGRGDADAALARCEEGLAVEGPTLARSGLLRVGIESLCALGRPVEAIEWVEALRGLTSNRPLCDFLEGSARMQLGDHERAAELLSDVEDVWDDLGLGAATDVIRSRRALALCAAERWPDAAMELAGLLHDRPMQPLWAQAITAHVRADQALDALVDCALDMGTGLRSVGAQVLVSETDVADEWGEALWARAADDPRVVAFAAHVGERLPAARCLEWSARIRAAGIAEHCPLVRRASAAHIPALERARCAAIAVAAFADDRARECCARAARDVPPTELRSCLLELDELCPELLPGFVTAAASDAARGAAVADVLDELGATEQADIVRATTGSQVLH